MKHRFGSLAAALGCVTLLVVACGGSSFEGPSGSSGAPSAGANSSGTGGKASGGSSGGTASGGTASGGSASGGVASGGTASGGSATGGTASGGSASGGGGTASGGTTGDPLKCDADTDCVACAYPTAPQTAAECYCASCAGIPLSKTACASNHEAWTKTCGATPRPCPAIACIVPPIPKCKSHLCVAG